MVLSREELYHLQRKLQTMSITGLYDYYRAAYHRCRIEGYAIPPARAIQELVQAWKATRKAKPSSLICQIHFAKSVVRSFRLDRRMASHTDGIPY
jgi:hypothetical protein